MWSGFEKFNTKPDNSSSRNETIDHISTIAGSLASIGTEHTESPVIRFFPTYSAVFVSTYQHISCLIDFCFPYIRLYILLFQCLDERVYDTDHTDLNSDFDESELRRELLEDVSPKRKNMFTISLEAKQLPNELSSFFLCFCGSATEEMATALRQI